MHPFCLPTFSAEQTARCLPFIGNVLVEDEIFHACHWNVRKLLMKLISARRNQRLLGPKTLLELSIAH
jgi:hypothetical protein